MSSLEASALWSQLRHAGLVEGDAPTESAALTPWYIRTMLGIAGWIGAMFLLGFVGGIFSLVMKSASAALLMGALLCAAAIVLYRARPQGDFVNQFALAVSIAGQSLIAVGLEQFFTSQIAVVAIVFAVIEAALFWLVPNFLHRVLSSAAAAGALVVALSLWGLYPYTQAIVLAAFSWAWLNEFSLPHRTAELRALGYGLTLLVLAGLVTHSTMGSPHSWWGRGGLALVGGQFAFWIAAILVGVILLWVVRAILVRQEIAVAYGSGRAALAGAVLVALISIKAPGFGIAVTMLLLGFANGNRVLTGLGVFALLAYWSYYYYLLEYTLLQKSALLLCAGVALLVARHAMQRRWPGDSAARVHHA